MKVPFYYNKTAVALATASIIISTAILGYFSYNYTAGGANAVEESLRQSNIKLVEQAVKQIEQKIIDNDRILYDMADVNERESWPAINEEIKRADLNVDQVWFLQPNGTILYPKSSRHFYNSFTKSFDVRQLNLDQLRLGETNHLHRERVDDYFFASYVLKENREGEKILVCFQMNPDKIRALVDKYLKDLSPSYYVSVVDYENNGIFRDPIPRTNKYYWESRFPTTLYKWILQVVPQGHAKIEQDLRNQRRINFFFMILSMFLIFLGLVIIYVAGRRERQLTQLKEDFISNVSHELKTPLSLIRMFSEILVMGKVKDKATEAEYHSIIHNESDRMTRLITNLLDFASLERGMDKKHFEKTNIAELVTKGLEAYRYQIQKQGFQLSTRVDEVPETLADPNSLTLALFNLLDNSLKYSGEQKQITVSVVQTNGFVDLAVSDRGIGIPKEEWPRIFEKFYRGSNAAVQKIRGSGIGLSITKHVAELHGGSVLLESEPGEGSTFTLRIPVRQVPELANKPAISS